MYTIVVYSKTYEYLLESTCHSHIHILSILSMCYSYGRQSCSDFTISKSYFLLCSKCSGTAIFLFMVSLYFSLVTMVQNHYCTITRIILEKGNLHSQSHLLNCNDYFYIIILNLKIKLPQVVKYIWKIVFIRFDTTYSFRHPLGG